MSPADLTVDDLLALNRQATVARLVSALVHDVNNALQVISGSVELIQGRDDLAASVQTGLARISGQVAHAATTVAAVTAFSQSHASQSQPEPSGPVAVGATVLRGVALRRHALSRANIEVVLDIDSDGDPDDVRVLGQPSQLLLIVVNLLHNAEHALSQVRGRRLSLSLTREGADVVLRVANNGAGVPVDDRERLFDPFASTGPRADVLGLGLPVSAHLARAHGGSLVLEPSATGACFALRLPRLEPEA
jgi:signal transduction histidine kinase